MKSNSNDARIAQQWASAGGMMLCFEVTRAVILLKSRGEGRLKQEAPLMCPVLLSGL